MGIILSYREGQTKTTQSLRLSSMTLSQWTQHGAEQHPGWAHVWSRGREWPLWWGRVRAGSCRSQECSWGGHVGYLTCRLGTCDTDEHVTTQMK